MTISSTADQADFHLRFWGVRGTIACPGPDYIRYGGNTSCIEVRCGDRLLVLDAGTGLRPLGARLATAGAVDLDLLLTHTHLDHIAGLPFFVPLFLPGNRFRMWAGHLLNQENTLEGSVCRMMSAPLFPVPFDALESEIEFREFESGHDIDLGDGIMVRTKPLNHPTA